MQHRQALWCSARADARRARPEFLLRWAATRCDDAEFSLLAQPAGFELLCGGRELLRTLAVLIDGLAQALELGIARAKDAVHAVNSLSVGLAPPVPRGRKAS